MKKGRHAVMDLAFAIFKYFPYGGIQRDLVRIAGQCVTAGHRVRIYTLEWRGDVPPGVEVIEVPVRGLANHRRYARFARRLQDALAQCPADLVVGMNKMPGLDVYFAGDGCFVEAARRKRSSLYRLSSRYRLFAAFERAVQLLKRHRPVLEAGAKKLLLQETLDQGDLEVLQRTLPVAAVGRYAG
jgi:UDP-glucose:(heptosyl)LPS alpha-1,3-glucosyltransferase